MPPDLLRLAIQCENWRCLPKSGGLLDQPYGLMDKLTLVRRYYLVAQKYSNLSPKDVSEFIETDTVYNIIKEINRLREEYGES